MRLKLNIHSVEYELSPIHQDDGIALSPIMADEQTRLFLPQLCELFDEINGFSIMINSFETYQSEGTGFLLGIRCNDDLLGFVAVMDVPICPSIFYAMHPRYRGKGIMKACVGKVLEYLSSDNICLSVQTYVSKDNERSLYLLQALGFTRKVQTGEEGVDVYEKSL